MSVEINIGSIIRQRAKELRIGPTELGNKINTSKQNVYGIYKRKSIDARLLMKISVALDFDFFRYYSNSLHVTDSPPESENVAESMKRLEQLRVECDAIRKENDYLKRINHLLEEKLGPASAK